MKKILGWLNRKGISTDAFVLILLVVGLAIAISIFVFFIVRGKTSGEILFNLTEPLEGSSGFLS